MVDTEGGGHKYGFGKSCMDPDPVYQNSDTDPSYIIYDLLEKCKYFKSDEFEFYSFIIHDFS